MSSIMVQIKLRNSVQSENEIIDLIRKSGKRSGVPRLLLIAGYHALYDNEGRITSVDKTSLVKAKDKSNEFRKYMVKG